MVMVVSKSYYHHYNRLRTTIGNISMIFFPLRLSISFGGEENAKIWCRRKRGHLPTLSRIIYLS